MPQNPIKSFRETPAAVSGFVGDARTDGELWVRELDLQHLDLRGVFVMLTERIERVPTIDDRSDSHSDLLEFVADASQLLEAHFAFEEAGGYLSDVLAIAPRLSDRAARLQRDHDHLAARFSKLATYARGMRATYQNWKRLGMAIGEFTQDLRLHESEENRLIQEAFLDDLGGG